MYRTGAARSFSATVIAAALLGTSLPAIAQVSIVQPGAPGEAPRELSAEEATALASAGYTPADVAFMQGMIVHHQQAVDMAALVADRTNREEIVAVAGRIDASQEDEIGFMREWLAGHGEVEDMPAMGHAGHSGMEGMASPEDMARLAEARGINFDRLFLELMIEHHKGAVTMVEELHELPGTAYEPRMFEFTNEVVTDQNAEIERMIAVLASLSDDPRAGLASGFLDAGEAISGLRHVAFLEKPAGFFDANNPSGEQPLIEEDEDEKTETGETAADAADEHAAHMAHMEADGEAPADPEGEEEEAEPRFGERGAPLSFANTDMAFSGDVMVAGSYHGFNAYRLGADGVPELLSSVVCPGGQGDVSIVGDILIMSVEQTRGRVDCGLQGVTEKVSEDRFRGLRIFDISDIRRPVQVGQVQTCRGSHTHSVVSQTPTSLIVYNSGTSRVREEEELAGCIGDVPGDDRTSLFSIDVIEIPLADPSLSRIVSSPRVFADPETGRLAGLWQGGDHGDDTQDTGRTDQCHDITVFPTLNIAAGACSGNGIIFDISDPLNPVRIDEVVDEGFAYWHSATFNNDGTMVLFTDEWGGGGRPRCQASDPRNWGADAIYEIVDGELEFRSLYKLPAPQSDKENCVAHNGSIIPVPGRNIFVQAWYQGGISIMDFTDPANPFEIAYFDRGPIAEDQLAMGGYWSAYWYNGRIYATEIARGIDVFALEPSEFLTAEEIAAAEAAEMGETFNPQTQLPVTWPDEVVMRVEDSRKGG
ncbi:DUF305 domain-containing protein [Alteraurantiacibacter aquimixticola]|uniref:DUF305 domain-containing protein n=1 Tax=Alteraurantiacibacter aquimixticola TaxID=2489173 RepID=A0A4V4U8E6_9SPHN|nr:DUF305 domain-containing protein [Alteraurantiacibacter aquimixticola]TIX49450.1 DUF305 domain-containing protein [Alteraurantiacibacter aquimixticola]